MITAMSVVSGSRRIRTFKFHFFGLAKIDLDGSHSSKNIDTHFKQGFTLIYSLDLSRECRKRARLNSDRVADSVNDSPLFPHGHSFFARPREVDTLRFRRDAVNHV